MIVEVTLNQFNQRPEKQWEFLTFLGQMMCGANMVAKLRADILLACWLRAVWWSKSSSSFSRLRLAGGSSMNSSWNVSIWRSLSGTFVLSPLSSKRVSSRSRRSFFILNTVFIRTKLYIQWPLYPAHLSNCSLTRTTNQPITRQKLNVFRHEDMVKTRGLQPFMLLFS